MGEHSFDSLHDTPRVRATDEAGIPKGAFGLLPNRLYPRPGVASSWMEAVANANKRIAGEMPPIKGSVDDESPELYRKPPKGMAFGKTFAAQSGSLDEAAVDALRAPKEVGGPSDEEDKPDNEHEKLSSGTEKEHEKLSSGIAPANLTPAPPPPESRPSYQPEMLPGDPFADPGFPVQSTPVRSEEVVRNMSYDEYKALLAREQQQAELAREHLEADKPKRTRQKAQIIEKIVEKPVYVTKEVPVFKEVEKIVEKEVVKPGPFEKWYEQRVRVTIATPEMQFSISAIAVSRALFSLVVFLPTKGDTFAFVPKAGTSIRVGYQNKVEDTVFTGVTFDLEELGILGLCFLVKGDNTPEKMGAAAS